MIKKIGKDFFSGQLNLTRISFPIKLMVPKSILESSTMGCNELIIKVPCFQFTSTKQHKKVIQS